MKKKKLTAIIAAFVIIACLAAGSTFVINSSKPVDSVAAVNQDKLIMDVYTDKSRYNPGDKVNISMDLRNETDSDFAGVLEMKFKHINKEVEVKKESINLKKGENKKIEIEWKSPAEDFKGYLLEVRAKDGRKLLDKRNTAIDISSDWAKFPRYGYLADYPKQESEITSSVIERLNKFHINGLQFYDWQYKHEKPLSGTVDKPVDKWPDIANRDTYSQTVKDYIKFAHDKNMMAANYNLIFGAYYNYEESGAKKEWGLYKDDEHIEQDYHPLPSSWATDKINIMNPANNEWQNFYVEKEIEAMRVYDFDVLHGDTLGPRGTLYDYDGKEVKLQETYAGFLNKFKKATSKRILLNTVSEYGKNEVAKTADLDFLYTEVWPPSFKSYETLKRTIDNDIALTDGKKASVIAAYMNYGINGQTGEFNEHAVRLTDAAIFAAGGAHLELGDGGMLSSEYFPVKNLKVTSSLDRALRSYYDFLVAYENILRDGMKDLEVDIKIDGINTSNEAMTENVWTYSKENDKYMTVQFINLLSRGENSWRDDSGDCEAPEVKKDFVVKVYTDLTKVRNINLASPDLQDGTSVALNYETKKDDNGSYLEIKVPELKYWDMIYIEK